MKISLIIIALITALSGSNVVKVEQRFQKSTNCKTCHLHIVNEWEKSWHAKSHYKNDEYFRATVDYVKKKTRKSLNAVKIECATCHNPRIPVTNVDLNHEMLASMNIETDSKIDKAVNSDVISEGINCVVCHNIDKIHSDKDESQRGINRVTWMKSGIMTGPYDNAKSPYHKTQQRDFMNKNSNELCFVCHANDKSVTGLIFTNMQSEFNTKEKYCVDCHMGPKKDGVASTLPIDNGKARKRQIREHGFQGAHISSMWKDALSIELKQEKWDIIIEISNPQPHNIPSGFGARELVLEISYSDDTKEINSKSISLTRHYTRRNGKPTIPHTAEKASKDMSIPAEGKRVLKVPNFEGATMVKVDLYYRLVNDEVRSILKLKEDIWSKKSFITTKELKFKKFSH